MKMKEPAPAAQMINGARIKQIRELRQLTQTDLSKKVGVEQATIALIESGRRQPSSELLKAISAETGFPAGYFGQGDIEDFPLGSLLFRAKASMTSREESSAHRYAQVMFEITRKLGQRLKTIPLRLPRLEGEEPATAARITRAMLGLSPDQPVVNLINALERSGVIGLAVPAILEKQDAFSGWAGSDESRPVIAVCDGKSGDRLRFSVAHELCHLVLHQAITGRIAEVEDQADAFAAEFLMPSATLQQELVPPITISMLAALKPRWGVSIRSLIMRAHELGLITLHQYKYLNKQIALRGWTKQEPANLAIPTEKPRTIPEMAESLYGKSIDIDKFSRDVGMNPEFIKGILDAHKSVDPPRPKGRHGPLTLIRSKRA